EKAAQQQQVRVKAEEQARLTIAKRNQERADKERLEEAQKQARSNLEQRRDAAASQARTLRPQLDRLRSELETTRAAITRGAERKRELQKEQSFLDRYI